MSLESEADARERWQEQLEATYHESVKLWAVNADLLAACKLAVKFWYSDHPNDTVEGHEALRTIEAAIARAEETRR